MSTMIRLVKTTFNNIGMVQKRKLNGKFIEKAEKFSVNNVFIQAEKKLDDKSFKNINGLISTETSELIMLIQSVKNIQHPIMEEVRNIIYDDGITWGMIVMLFSKLTETHIEQISKNKTEIEETLQDQLKIAKVTQMLFMAIRIHECVTNANSSYSNNGNKLAILCGDYLLTKCTTVLASLRDHELIEYMASACRDLTITHYIGPRDKNNKPYPLKPITTPEDISFLESYSCEPIQISNSLNNFKTDWILRNTLGDSGLLGKACSSILKLSGYSQLYQNLGFSFGKYCGLTYQALKDMNNVRSKTDDIDLISLPVLLHLPNDPELYEYIEKYKEDIDEMDHNLVRRKIIDGNALEEAHNLQKQYANAANCVLNIFGESDAKIILQDILKNIELGNNIYLVSDYLHF